MDSAIKKYYYTACGTKWFCSIADLLSKLLTLLNTFKETVMKKEMLVTMLVMLLALTSCAQENFSKGAQGAGMGAIGGAILGQAIGGTHQGTLIGAAIGGTLGYIIGNEMDKQDRERLNNAYETGASGQVTSWQNPDNGNAYQVVPQPAYTQPAYPNRPCRQAEVIATIDGKTERTYTTACRNTYGQWELQQQ
jgi:surface antigen